VIDLQVHTALAELLELAESRMDEGVDRSRPLPGSAAGFFQEIEQLDAGIGERIIHRLGVGVDGAADPLRCAPATAFMTLRSYMPMCRPSSPIGVGCSLPRPPVETFSTPAFVGRDAIVVDHAFREGRGQAFPRCTRPSGAANGRECPSRLLSGKKPVGRHDVCAAAPRGLGHQLGMAADLGRG